MSYCASGSTILKSPVLIAEGDSLTRFNRGLWTDWPSLIAPTIPGWEIRNIAIGGDTTGGVLASFVQQISPILAESHPQKVLVLWIGTNDFPLNVTAATALANVESVANSASGEGATKVIAVTILPNGSLTNPQNTQRLAYNSALVTNANGKFSRVVRLDLVPELLDPANTTYFLGDQLHLTTAGQTLVAPLIRTAILT